MIDLGKHIISRFQWQTTFDQKEKAFELQNRIGAWSKFSLYREIAAVFDSLCPPNETWVIDQLEIDLGTIEFDSLEPALGSRLQARLREKIMDLILVPYQSAGKLEIRNHTHSQLYLLRKFFTTGVPEWNHQWEVLSINEMMRLQLRDNQRNTLEMIEETGSIDVNARRRIAWQLDENNLEGILRGIEPGNCDVILEFSDHLIRLQEKRSVVKSGSVEFKKNVWFWLLGHLLTERGTIFNRVVFVKSTIRQMADHHNLLFTDLLSAISIAFEETIGKTLVNGGFMQVLEILLKEEKRRGLSPDKVNGSPEAKTAEFKEKEILENIDQLGISELNQLFYRLTNRYRLLHRAGIDLILELVRAEYSEREEKEMLQMAIRYLTSSKRDLSIRSFMQEMISSLAQKRNIKPAALIRELVALDERFGRTDFINLKEFLVEEWVVQISGDKAIEIEQSIRRLLYSEGVDFSVLHRWENELNHLAQSCPEDVLNWLKSEEAEKYSSRDKLAFLRNESLLVLLKKSKDHRAVWLVEFYARVSTVLPRLTEAIYQICLLENLLRTGMKMLIDRKSWSKTDLLLISSGLKGTNDFAPSRQGMRNYLKRLADQMGIDFFDAEVKTLTDLLQENKQVDVFTPFSIDTLQNLISGKLDRQDLTEYLESNFSDPGLIRFRSQSQSHLFTELTELLVAGASKIIHQPEKKISGWIQLSLPELAPGQESEWKDIFWKCILRYDLHQGNLEIFKNMLLKAWVFVLDSQADMGASYSYTGKLALVAIDGIDRGAFDISPETSGTNNDEMQIPEAPASFFRNVKDVGLSRTEFNKLQGDLTFNEFCLQLIPGLRGQIKRALQSALELSRLTDSLPSGKLKKELAGLLRDFAWDLLSSSKGEIQKLDTLVRSYLEMLYLEEGIGVERTIRLLESEANHWPAVLVERVSLLLPDLKLRSEAEVGRVRIIESLESAGWIREFLTELLNHGKIPYWFTETQNIEEIISQLCKSAPGDLMNYLADLPCTDPELRKLHGIFGIENLTEALARTSPGNARILKIVSEFYQALNHFSQQSVSVTVLRFLIFKRVFFAWKNKTWKQLSFEVLITELCWELSYKHGVSKENFLVDLEKCSPHLPVSVRPVIEEISYKKTKPEKRLIIQEPVIKKIPLPGLSGKSEVRVGIPVKNAGIVLLSGYMRMLLDRLGAISGDAFVSDEMQKSAVHFLQYVVTGITRTEETFLILNKILCGLDISEPVLDEISMKEEQVKTVESLIRAAISHWPVIGECSIDGFRGNWLVRDGILYETEEKWELVVEKRAYDLLIHKSPYSFSIINFPWMKKPVYVSWPF